MPEKKPYFGTKNMRTNEEVGQEKSVNKASNSDLGKKAD